MDLFGRKAAARIVDLERTLKYTRTKLEELEPLAEQTPQLEKQLKHAQSKIAELERREEQVLALEDQLKDAQAKLNELGFEEYKQTKAAIDQMDSERAQKESMISLLQRNIKDLLKEEEKLTRQNRSTSKKLTNLKELYNSVEYAISAFFERDPQMSLCKLSPRERADYDELSPSVILNLHVMDIKALRKAFRDNDKQIESLLSNYAARYTTKTNQTIYKLMVVALRAELQNILYNLKYEKLDAATEQVKDMTAKYLFIASEGNQNIAGTLTKFIGEIEYLFINAVKIEYNYYVKKEQARQEQLEIREKMKQEAAERKALEEERKRVEREENKYNDEIQRVRQQMAEAHESDLERLNQRILELQGLLSDVAVKKEDIVRLQNGKAGNIYVVSNLGSFGDNIFKIGMTRRLNPQERIDELGSASVPFKFDVHSFIFSEDAASLESQLHQKLNNQRVNKVNLRKEFFYSTVDELEQLVSSIDPTAEFTKTMLAEEFRQSQSTDQNYTTEQTTEEEED